MTWGQLRLQLQTSAPGVSLDLLDEWLNTRYEQVLEATDWQGLKYHAIVRTQAAYQSSTDSVTFTVGNAAVVGAGTTWTAGLVGQKMYRPGDSTIYTVTTWTDATHLALDRPYEGNGIDPPATAYAGAPYVFMQNVYALPGDVRSIVEVLDPVSGFPMNLMSKAQLDQSAGPRTLVNDPKSCAPIEDSAETSPPVVKQLEFFPPPLHARGFPVEYVHTALAFDGGNTSGVPLPFVSNTVLLAGVRADIATHLEKPAQAVIYEAAFMRELNRLLLVEHAQRRVKTPIRMADRFTRHRLNRASRGTNNSWGPGAGGPN